MATRNCPHCAEDIQAAAVLCKHCGQPIGSLTAARGAVSPAAVNNDSILAVIKAFGTPGKWSALVCTPETMVVKTIIPAAVGTGVPLACVIILIFNFVAGVFGGIAALVTFTHIQKRRVEAWAQAKRYHGALRDASDRAIDIAGIQQLAITSSVGRKKSHHRARARAGSPVPRPRGRRAPGATLPRADGRAVRRRCAMTMPAPAVKTCPFCAEENQRHAAPGAGVPFERRYTWITWSSNAHSATPRAPRPARWSGGRCGARNAGRASCSTPPRYRRCPRHPPMTAGTRTPTSARPPR